MKKLYFVLIAFFLTCSISFAQVADDVESFIPSEVQIFLKTKEISKLTKSMNYIVNNLMDEKQKSDFFAKKDEFKKNTGIDYLDERSLRSAGIDTNRPVSLAIFDKDNNNDVSLFFIPVLNEGEAALRFIEVLKRMNPDDPDFHVKPVTTKYKNMTVYELKKGMYVTSAYKYLVVGSTSEIIKKVIDYKGTGKGTLILDAHYKDFLANMAGKHDLNVFMTKRFIMDSDMPFNSNNITENSFENSIDYISAGMGLDNNKFQINASIKFAKDDKTAKEYLNFFKTGIHNSSLHIPAADSIMFLSLDYKYINDYCKGDIEWCEQFNSMKERMKNEIGVDFEKDFLPHFTGSMNIISQDTGSIFDGVGDVLVFFPAINSAKIEEVWNKMRKVFQGKYSKDKKFGEEKVGSSKAFWFIDESQMRVFVSYDKRGLYAGNNTALMKNCMSGNTIAASKNASGRYKDIINDKTFYILNIKKNSLLTMFLHMSAQGNSEIAGWINRLGEIFLYGEKNDNLISINFEVEIKEARGKK